jgi:homoserine dehydrogenase
LPARFRKRKPRVSPRVREKARGPPEAQDRLSHHRHRERRGWIADPKGISIPSGAGALAHEILPASQPCDVRDWLREAQADVLFEATSLNVNSGQPAIDHIRAALEMGAHAITANEGTVVHAYHELRALAASKNRRFFSSQP